MKKQAGIRQVYHPPEKLAKSRRRVRQRETPHDSSGIPSSSDGPRWAAPLGAAVLILAMIGVASLVTTVVPKLLPASAAPDFERYNALIAPAVLFDPPPFSKVEEADDEFVLKTSVWAALEEHLDTLSYDEIGYMQLPGQLALDKCAALFGAARPITLKTFTQQNVVFEYDAADGCFHIPVTGHIGLYIPRVEAVKHKRGVTTLTVAYLSAEEGSEDPTVMKRMLYTLQGPENSETIAGVQALK